MKRLHENVYDTSDVIRANLRKENVMLMVRITERVMSMAILMWQYWFYGAQSDGSKKKQTETM